MIFIRQQGTYKLKPMGMGMIAMQQSLAALKYLLGAPLPWGVVHYADGWADEYSAITLTARPDCPLCGGGD